MRLLVILAMLSACGNKRTVVIKSDDPKLSIEVNTEVSEHGEEPGEVRVVVSAHAIVPLLIVPMPVPYERAPSPLTVTSCGTWSSPIVERP